LSQIEDVVATHTPIATNTSAIPIRELQANRSHPERLIGMHWAEPAYATRFMELICGEATNRETVRMTRDLAERCEKDVCVIAKDVPGFIANRLGYAMIREALNLVEMGVADAETIDRSFRNSIGLWAGFCGPFRWIDITGGPELYAKAMAPVWPTLSNADTPTPMSRNANKDGDEQSHHSGMFPWHRGDTADWEAAFHRHAWRVYHAAKRQGSGESKS
jgi:3-hydroxybutyryl-CoA dehydrogenase